MREVKKPTFQECLFAGQKLQRQIIGALAFGGAVWVAFSLGQIMQNLLAPLN